ncbi:uncharacterized protein BCR38DRAFT_119853 [Pseudomassariella vexata]|uniref:Inhibitor of growth protein N-terminal histone-binding domain-containing protein n=1 Tax=Pseudomassariella vexata TaxID=1141098 RepID=A0A1Y2DAB6_9PEZI|nr:uncharacterized protein BCR38DRAFT_119853 [Pseudomassariella vexata]ORY56094.1 hypothetical protein BCR38DRAFT_119853 [Pseudomassariella vexata]
MKTAKPPQAEAGPAPSSRRAQPFRQTRTNPPRSSGLTRSLNGPDASHDQPIDIFPAITHFTDAITSLPKDLVRHFTLLKEVDAKIFAPEDTLFQLVDAALKTNRSESRPANDATSSTAPVSAPMSARNSSVGFVMGTNGNLPPASSTDDNYNATVFDPANLPRRQLFRQTAFKIQEMLVALEEKNHVISTANDALSRQLARIDDVWPHLEGEFSDEAKWGSTTHWAYPENRAQRASAAERSRRDGASAITAAAQQLAEEAAARSELRKQAVAAKKGLKNHHQDSDLDADHENNKQQKGESSKKSGNGSKSRKNAEASALVGLGITAGAPVNGNTPAPKKRKVDNSKDKPINGGQPMERAMSSVFGNSAPKSKNSSPRATPVPEAGVVPTKKRKALPTANGQSKKRNGLPTALSPSIASSPIQPNLVDTKNIAHSAPAPSATAARPASSRARQNSTAANTENSRQRPASSASNRPNGVLPPIADAGAVQTASRVINDIKPFKETPIPVKTETIKEATPQPTVSGNTIIRSRKNSVAKPEDVEPRPESVQPTPPTVTTVVTTKSGRASKPSTPALGGFPEAIRSRSSRNAQTGTAKRSHKKGAAAQAALAAQAVNNEDAASSAQGDDVDEIDADELRYCYCNGVSYGEMVACDADDCEKEWFHLGCVGLKSAPGPSSKLDLYGETESIVALELTRT